MTLQSALLKSTLQRDSYKGISLGKVFNVYPEIYAVDVMFMDGSILKRIPVVTQYASSRTGLSDLPIPEYKDGGLLDKKSPLLPCEPGESDVFAIVVFLDNSLFKGVVLGFLFPIETELLCSRTQEGNAKASQCLFKHASNVYTRITDEGDIEISHPSGVFIKIGANCYQTEIHNIDEQARKFDWKNPDGSGELTSAPYVYVKHPSGNDLTIDPEGNVTENVVGNVDRTIKGNLTETIEGIVDRTVKGNVSETMEGNYEKIVRKDMIQTVEGGGSLSVKGDSTTFTEGDTNNITKGRKTDSITGAWVRSSGEAISDNAPIIEHN